MPQIDNSLRNKLLEQKLLKDISTLITNQFSIDEFLIMYSTADSFLSSQYGITYQHFNEISKDDFRKAYENACNKIKTMKAPVEETNVHTESKPKVRQKKLNVAGFVDTLILAFITGSFIGIIILNIYSKIVQNI